MRFAPMAVAAATTVAVATGVSVAPQAHAQAGKVDTRIDRDALVAELGLKFAPPAVRIGGDLYVLIDGVYVKADTELPPHVKDSLRDPNRDQTEPQYASLTETEVRGSSTGESSNRTQSDKRDIAKWLVPLLVTGGVVAGLAGLIKKLYPSGRLIVYYQPGKAITL